MASVLKNLTMKVLITIWYIKDKVDNQNMLKNIIMIKS